MMEEKPKRKRKKRRLRKFSDDGGRGRPTVPSSGKGTFKKGSPEYNKISSAVSNGIVRFISKNKHMNQKHFAELIGVHRMTITHYIKGAKIPELMSFLRMIAIGVEINMKLTEIFIAEDKEGK